MIRTDAIGFIGAAGIVVADLNSDGANDIAYTGSDETVILPLSVL